MTPRMTIGLPIALTVAVSLLAACETTSAALEGVGGVFTGASHDVRSLNRR